jgi:hypothetical protein
MARMRSRATGACLWCRGRIAYSDGSAEPAGLDANVCLIITVRTLALASALAWSVCMSRPMGLELDSDWPRSRHADAMPWNTASEHAHNIVSVQPYAPMCTPHTRAGERERRAWRERRRRDGTSLVLCMGLPFVRSRREVAYRRGSIRVLAAGSKYSSTHYRSSNLIGTETKMRKIG